jgi:hypothetical protein
VVFAYNEFEDEEVGASFSDKQIGGYRRIPVMFPMMIPHVDALGKARELAFKSRNDFHSDVM